LRLNLNFDKELLKLNNEMGDSIVVERKGSDTVNTSNFVKNVG